MSRQDKWHPALGGTLPPAWNSILWLKANTFITFPLLWDAYGEVFNAFATAGKLSIIACMDWQLINVTGIALDNLETPDAVKFSGAVDNASASSAVTTVCSRCWLWQLSLLLELWILPKLFGELQECSPSIKFLAKNYSSHTFYLFFRQLLLFVSYLLSLSPPRLPFTMGILGRPGSRNNQSYRSHNSENTIKCQALPNLSCFFVHLKTGHLHMHIDWV